MSINNILTRSIAFAFFRQQAGFFLFLFFILLGIYPNIHQVIQVHYGFIIGFLTIPSNFWIAFLLWFLYALKIAHYFYACTEKDSYAFLQNMNAINGQSRFRYLLQLTLLMFSPVLVYGIIIILVSILQNHLLGGISVFIAILLLVIFISYLFFISLQKTKPRLGIFQKIIPRINFPKNLFSFLMQFIFREQFLVLAALKLISFCCLYFFISTDPDSYKDRILWLIFVTSMLGHSFFIYKIHHFMETKLSFYRNMPIRLFITILQLLGVYFLLLIPELWALKGIALLHHAYSDYFILAGMAPCMLLLMNALLYTEDYSIEDFLKMLFGVWVVYFFFGLSQLRWMMPCLSLVAAFIIFFSAYYKYEKNRGIEGME